MKYKKDLVSVIIPTYRRSEMLNRAITSVLKQTHKEVEVIVVNDNVSRTDEYSLALYKEIASINNEKVILVEQEKHINGAAARNVGIHVAKGEYIAFLDDDDYWDNNKLEIQIETLNTLDSSYGAVSCLDVVRKDGKIISAMMPYSDGSILVDILERRIGIGMDAPLFRREALDDAGYFDERLSRHQDLQLFAQFAQKYKIRLVKRYLNNIDASDSQNRPDPVNLEKVKMEYFESISSIMNSLSKRQRKRVIALHKFETAYAYIKSGNKSKGIRMSLGVMCSPITCYLALERCFRKIIERKFNSALLKKYSN